MWEEWKWRTKDDFQVAASKVRQILIGANVNANTLWSYHSLKENETGMF